MRFKQIPLETVYDLRQDSFNMINRCEESIRNIEEIEQQIKKSIGTRELVYVLEEMFFEKIIDINEFLLVITLDKLDSFINNFVKAKGIFGFEKIVDMTLKDRNL